MVFQFRKAPQFYQTHGKGPAMVLLHGFLEDGTIWDRYVDHLSKKYFLIVLDLPGHGKSGVVAKTHSMELMAEAVYELLQLLKIDTVVLVGHSMGGYVSLAFAEMHPETLSGLVLLNSTPEADGPERIENRNRALEMIPKEKEKIIGMALSNLFSENARTLYCDEIKKLKQQANGFATEGILANIRGMRDRKDRTSILTAVSKTKWLLCGDQDPVVPLKTSRNVSKKPVPLSKYCMGATWDGLKMKLILKIFYFLSIFFTLNRFLKDFFLYLVHPKIENHEKQLLKTIVLLFWFRLQYFWARLRYYPQGHQSHQ